MIFRSLTSNLLCLCLGVSFVTAESLTGSRLLVVLEDAELRPLYSKFFGDLEGSGYKVDFQSPKNETLSLFTHGERAYDHAILFPPKAKGYGSSLTPQKLVEFVHSDGNILLLTSPSSTPEQARELGRELDIDLPPRDFLALDHSSYDTLSAADSGKHDVILIPRPTLSASTQNYFSSKKGELIAFRGAGHGLGNRPLLFPVLSAGRTAYTYDTKEDFSYTEDPWTAGRQMHYVTAMQARNNARVVIAGSTDMFSDAFFDMKVKAPKTEKEVATANRKFAEEITSWVFMETGVVKVKAIRHHLANTTDAEVNPHVYRVKNDINFEIELSEWSSNTWKPFTVPRLDHLQLEFTMLDPYYRVPLLPSSSTPTSSVYAVAFKAPDQHGIFAFTVNYKRPFITYVEEKYTVTLRHFAHNEYTRSWDISGAWVWIAGIAATIGGFTVFCALWLYSAPTERSTKKTQ